MEEVWWTSWIPILSHSHIYYILSTCTLQGCQISTPGSFILVAKWLKFQTLGDLVHRCKTHIYVILIFLNQLIPIFFWSIKWDITWYHRKRNASHPSETIDPRHWAINNARDETESQAIRQGWDTKLVRRDGCRIGILPGCFFSKKKLPEKQKKRFISVGLPTQVFCWLMYYSFMLIFVARSCQGDGWDGIFGFAVSMKQLTNSLIVGSVPYFSFIPGMGIGSF